MRFKLCSVCLKPSLIRPCKAKVSYYFLDVAYKTNYLIDFTEMKNFYLNT